MPLTDSFFKNLYYETILTIKKKISNPYKKVNINRFSKQSLKLKTPEKIHSHRLLEHETNFYGGFEYLHGLKEIFIEGVYNQKLPENAYILDCGAHIGLSVIYLRSICPSAHIVCFEPDAKNFNLLKKNISSHQLTNVCAKNEAVWIENTSLNFIEDGNMSSKIGKDTSSHNVTVKAIRLKDYMDERVDFLKMDIEGAEYKVLKDISEKLGNVNKMFIEYHGTFDQNNELLEIFEIITKAGFKFYIKEAASVFDQPFFSKTYAGEYDLQLNIFCFRSGG